MLFIAYHEVTEGWRQVADATLQLFGLRLVKAEEYVSLSRLHVPVAPIRNVKFNGKWVLFCDTEPIWEASIRVYFAIVSIGEVNFRPEPSTCECPTCTEER